MDDEEKGEPNLPAKLLKFQNIFGNCSLCKLHIIAGKGIIPKRLAKCTTPVYSSCIY